MKSDDSNKATRTLNAVILHNHRRILVALSGIILTLVLALALTGIRQSLLQAEAILIEQVLQVTEAAVRSHDLFLIQRELSRFTSIVESSFDSQVHMTISISGQRLAEVGSLSTISSPLVSHQQISKMLASSELLQVNLSTSFVGISVRYLIYFGAAFLLILCGFVILRRSLSQSISLATHELVEEVKHIKYLASNVPLRTVRKTTTNDSSIQELSDLQASIGTLLREIFASQKQLLEAQKVANDHEKRAIHAQAIARTTQMLAHDVRKPFSVVQAALTLFEQASSFEEIRDILPPVRTSIQTSLASVNSMIEDIMELERKKALSLEPFSPKHLVKISLEEVAQIHQEREITITYDWQHTSLAQVDPAKVRRVFSNIFANACEAIKGNGKIYVTTKQCNGRIHFVLGNHDSFIPADARNQLFEAFFTKDKKGGTGLGLAIAKKVVEDHGGEIAVTCDEMAKTVEFHFSLPASTSADKDCAQLPLKLVDFPIATKLVRKEAALSDNQDRLARRFVQLVDGQTRPVCVAILDDEAIYRDAIINLVRGTLIGDRIQFLTFSAASALLCSDIGIIDFLIADVDLGDSSCDGYDVVRKLIADPRFSGYCCIHSNKALSHDIDKALQSGAQAFQPKPMTLDHFLKFIVDGLMDIQ